VAFLIITIGVRALHFMPEDDFTQLQGATNITD
jgi:hypothetical protein